MLEFDESIYDVLKEPKRVIEVSIPIRMDNKKIKGSVIKSVLKRK